MGSWSELFGRRQNCQLKYRQYFEIQCKTETFFPFHVEMFQWLSVSQEFQFLFRSSYVGTDTQFTVSHEDVFLLFG